MSKVSWKDIFPGFQLTVFKNKLTFMKRVNPHTTTLMHFKARQVLRDPFNTNQGNEMTFVTGASKINLKNLKN